MKIIDEILMYIKERKNLLGYILVGLAILLAAFYLPIAPVLRVLILIAVIGFSLSRLSHVKKFMPTKE
jgi:hypothetical protein